MHTLQYYYAGIGRWPGGGCPLALRSYRAAVLARRAGIAPQPDPEVHGITLDIQWPVWAEKGMAEKLKNQAVEYAQAEAKP